MRFQLMDIENGYYLAKFESEEDYITMSFRKVRGCFMVIILLCNNEILSFQRKMNSHNV